jgi:hypothetical protein
MAEWAGSVVYNPLEGDVMRAFRALLIVLWLGIAGYTSVVAAHHGMGLLKVFFGDMTAFGIVARWYY